MRNGWPNRPGLLSSVSQSDGLYNVLFARVAVLPDPLAKKMGGWNVPEVLPPLLVAAAPDDVDGEMGLYHSLHTEDTVLIEWIHSGTDPRSRR